MHVLCWECQQTYEDVELTCNCLILFPSLKILEFVKTIPAKMIGAITKPVR